MFLAHSEKIIELDTFPSILIVPVIAPASGAGSLISATCVSKNEGDDDRTCPLAGEKYSN